VQSPLHEAAKHGNLPAIRALLQAGASLTLATAGSRAL
jgi:ankyrin repeat protein